MSEYRSELERVSKIEDPLQQAKEALVICNAMVANSEERIKYHTKHIDKVFGDKTYHDDDAKKDAFAILAEYKEILAEELKERDKITEYIKEKMELIQ